MKSYKRTFLMVAILCLLISVFITGCGSNKDNSSTNDTSSEIYPDRPIEVIVPFGAGGGSDVMVRKFVSIAEKEIGKPFVVSNVTGAAGATGTAQGLSADPNGYTLIAVESDGHTMIALGRTEFTTKDLCYVARTQYAVSMLFVPGDSPFKTMEDIIKYAKENPQKLKVAGSGAGSIEELTVAYLSRNGVELTFVPFGSPGERYASVLGKHNDILFEQPGDVKQWLDTGELRPIVVFYPERLNAEAFKDVPTAKELGFDIESGMWRGFAAK
ncbi:MAG: tripartite tricarboxylate transporter substrate binding protein [Dehalobacterium sp.]